MSITTSQDTRVQPWKAHWAPTQSESKSGTQYRANESGSLLIDGACVCAPGMMAGELARSSKEDDAPRAQPWKAHWSPTTPEAKLGTQYRADESGGLLIDGACVCAPGMMAGELARSSKEDEAL